MTNPRTINQVMEQLAEIDGQAVELEGILALEPEGYHLLHFPKAERKPGPAESDNIYQSGVWLAFGSGSLQPNHSALSRWLGKRVRVYGVARTIASLPAFGSLGRGGFGSHGLWPAQIEPYYNQRLSAEERREHEA